MRVTAAEDRISTIQCFDILSHLSTKIGFNVSLLPCGRQFAVIEGIKRKQDNSEMYTDWHAMIDSKYVTVQVTGHMIHDYKGDIDTLFK